MDGDKRANGWQGARKKSLQALLLYIWILIICPSYLAWCLAHCASGISHTRRQRPRFIPDADALLAAPTSQEEIKQDGRLSLQRLSHFKNKRENGEDIGWSQAWTIVERVIAVQEIGAKKTRAKVPPIENAVLGSSSLGRLQAPGPGHEDPTSVVVERAGPANSPAKALGRGISTTTTLPLRAGSLSESASDAGDRLYLVKWEGLGYDSCSWEVPEIATPQVRGPSLRPPIRQCPWFHRFPSRCVAWLR
eukprot:scaffold185550_cov33-Tisochrysis_lutea.AAC.6